MEIPTIQSSAASPVRGATVGAPAPSGENRLRSLRDLLAELQDEAKDVFASSGETVDRFLCERRAEVRREIGMMT